MNEKYNSNQYFISSYIDIIDIKILYLIMIQFHENNKKT